VPFFHPDPKNKTTRPSEASVLLSPFFSFIWGAAQLFSCSARPAVFDVPFASARRRDGSYRLSGQSPFFPVVPTARTIDAAREVGPPFFSVMMIFRASSIGSALVLIPSERQASPPSGF